MIVKLLTVHHLKFLSLKRGCTGSSESTLVKIPHRWKSHTIFLYCWKSVVDDNMTTMAQSHFGSLCTCKSGFEIFNNLTF